MGGARIPRRRNNPQTAGDESSGSGESSNSRRQGRLGGSNRRQRSGGEKSSCAGEEECSQTVRVECSSDDAECNDNAVGIIDEEKLKNWQKLVKIMLGNNIRK